MYRKTYSCVCEGQQEKMYLDHVAKLIKKFPRKVVTFNSYIGTPYRLTKIYETYDSVALFDFDFNQIEFEKNIKLCDKLNKEQKPTSRKSGRNIYHAYSNVNFDLWLILHKENRTGMVSTNNAYTPDIRKIFGLGSKDNIKNERTITKILDQITLQDVKDAIVRADKIRSCKVKRDASRVADTSIYSNPDFSIHNFLKIVLESSGDLGGGRP